MPRYTLQSDKELEKLGKVIIAKTKQHEQIKMLKIAYLFRAEAAVSEGRVIAGMAVRVDDRNYAIHKCDAIVEIAEDVWEELSPQMRELVMDHELCHIRVRLDDAGCAAIDEKTGRVKTYIKPHDIEEFEDILDRHKAIHPTYRKLLQKLSDAKKSDKKKETEEALEAKA